MMKAAVLLVGLAFALPAHGYSPSPGYSPSYSPAVASTVPADGKCPTIYDPVCGADGKRYGTPCFAALARTTVIYRGRDCTPQSCAELAWQSKCGCSTERITVCGNDGIDYGSGCYAECNGTTVKQMSSCSGPAVMCSCLPPADGADTTVCAPGGRTFGSACLARCAGFTGPYTAGPCPPKVATLSPAPDACQDVANVKDPICVLKSGAVKGITYQNPCYAMAAGFSAAKGDRYFKGNCSATCDAKCNPKTGTDMLGNKYKEFGYNGVYLQTCCDPGVEHINTCYAACLGMPQAVVAKCSAGLCTGARAVNMLKNTPCPVGAPAARCLVGNQCAGKAISCTGTYRISPFCVEGIYCGKFFRFSYLTNFCGAYIMDLTSGTLQPTCSLVAMPVKSPSPAIASTAKSPSPNRSPSPSTSPSPSGGKGASLYSPSSANNPSPDDKGYSPSSPGQSPSSPDNSPSPNDSSPGLYKAAVGSSATSSPSPSPATVTCAALGETCTLDSASLPPEYLALKVTCCGTAVCKAPVRPETAFGPVVGVMNGICVAETPV